MAGAVAAAGMAVARAQYHEGHDETVGDDGDSDGGDSDEGAGLAA